MTVKLDVLIDADTRGVVDGVDRAGTSFGDLGGLAKTAGLAIAAGLAVGGAAAIKLGADAIGAASDLNETLNKSSVIFGKHAEEMVVWASSAAENFGLSKQAALDAATGFGNMFAQLGQTKEEAAATSQQVVQLATDLGSFNNLETADVADRIGAAFRGEYDSLQALIPNINAARVEKEALAATGKTLADELTAEDMAMGALNVIMKDGKAAAGDFKETSEGLANQQKILRANFEDVKAEIGQKLLPVATEFFGYLNDTAIPRGRELAEELSKKLGPAIKNVGDFLTDDLGPGLKTVVPQLEDLLEGAKDTAEEIGDLEDALKDMFGLMDDESGSLIVGSMIGNLKLSLGVFQTITAQINLAVSALEKLIDLMKVDGLGGAFNPLGRVVGGTDLGSLGPGFVGGRGGGNGGDRIFMEWTVKLENGIVNDPVALGETIVNALERRAAAVGG